MFPISGFSPQISQGLPAQEARAQAGHDAAAQEPQDSFQPSEGLTDRDTGLQIGDRGALVRNDLGDRRFLKRESEHFIFQYMPDTDAERDIDEIVEKREMVFEMISSFLESTPGEKLSVYLFPTDRDSYCPTWGKTFAGRTIPEARMIGLAWLPDLESYERIHYGHEITHALEYDLFPPGKNVPPFLREGIADYLSGAGFDMHRRLRGFIDMEMVSEPFVIGDEKLNSAEYMESGSLVQHLVEAFGRTAFLSFYKASASLGKSEEMTRSSLSSLFSSTLSCDIDTVERLWTERFGPYITERSEIRVPADEELEILTMLQAAEKAADERDRSKLLSLYSSDFYYRDSGDDEELLSRHFSLPSGFSTERIECIPLGTWGYGKTVGVKAKRTENKGDSGHEWCFLVEKLFGSWRLSPKKPGGWALGSSAGSG